MAEQDASSSSNNGSLHSSNSDAFSSRPNSRRRRPRGGSSGTFRPVTSPYTETTHPCKSSARSKSASLSSQESSEYSPGEWKAVVTTDSAEKAKEEFTNCRRCPDFLSTPYLAFRLYLNTRNLQATTDTPTFGLPEDVQELLKLVNALMNDCGGTLCVHCSQHCPVSLLDRLLDHRFRGLIANTTLYEDNLERLVADEQHVIYRVKPTADPRISVFNFHSLLSDNQGLVEPSQAEIQFLIQRCSLPSSEMGANGVNEHVETHEFQHTRPVRLYPSCRVHLHEVDSSAIKRKLPSSYEAKVVSYWWDDLGLPRYIAAFGKQQAGGSIYLGIAERTEDGQKAWEEVENCDLGTIFPGCQKKVWVAAAAGKGKAAIYHVANDEDVPLTEEGHTGTYICQGLQLNQRERSALKATLLRRIRSDMLWYPSYPARVPLSVTFHPVSGGGRDLCVVEVKVSKFHGVAFHRRDGPEMYGIKTVGSNNTIRFITIEELVKQFNSLRVLREESQA